jgi:RNase H-fold protein (predicted Holliday junction resolvase)
MNSRSVIAIDPGTAKCGLALVSLNSKHEVQVIRHKVIQISDFCSEISAWVNEKAPEAFVVGTGTGSKAVVAELGERFPDAGILLLEEAFTTENARKRYWEENPPRGWRRFIPRTMLTPPEPVDDYAAVLLAEMALKEMVVEMN